MLFCKPLLWAAEDKALSTTFGKSVVGQFA